jgi:hypothetical protein
MELIREDRNLIKSGKHAEEDTAKMLLKIKAAILCV